MSNAVVNVSQVFTVFMAGSREERSFQMGSRVDGLPMGRRMNRAPIMEMPGKVTEYGMFQPVFVDLVTGRWLPLGDPFPIAGSNAKPKEEGQA